MKPARQQSTAERSAIARSCNQATAAGLEVIECEHCGAPIVWCRLAVGRAAVEIVQEGAGRVAIQGTLIAGTTPDAYDQQEPTRYTWHRDRCVGSFVGQARARKVRT